MNHRPLDAARHPSALDRGLRSCGAVLAAAAVALSAYASHAAEGDRTRLFMAAVLAFGHGVALVAMPASASRLARTASLALLLGSLLFAGSLVAAHFAGASTRLAPFGGLLMIAGWLLHAAAAWRR